MYVVRDSQILGNEIIQTNKRKCVTGGFWGRGAGIEEEKDGRGGGEALLFVCLFSFS